MERREAVIREEEREAVIREEKAVIREAVIRVESWRNKVGAYQCEMHECTHEG